MTWDLRWYVVDWKWWKRRDWGLGHPAVMGRRRHCDLQTVVWCVELVVVVHVRVVSFRVILVLLLSLLNRHREMRHDRGVRKKVLRCSRAMVVLIRR